MHLTKSKTALLAGCALFVSMGAALAQDHEPVSATMIIYLDPSVQFFNPVVKGAQDAAAAFDVDLDVQYANNDPVRQNDLIESAVATGVDGIAVSISSSDAFDDSICAAVEAGIVVIGFNNDDLEGADGNCRQAYVGMDEEASGYELGKRMIEAFDLKEGDVVFNPREIPEASFAVARGGGIERAMAEAGITVETVRAGLDPAEAQNIMAQALIANPDIKAVFGTGSVTSTVGAGAIRDAGVDVPFGGFDLAVEIADAVESGAMFATMDQQPYLQGYYPIAMIAMAALRPDAHRCRYRAGRLPRPVAYRGGKAAYRNLPLISQKVPRSGRCRQCHPLPAVRSPAGMPSFHWTWI